MFESRVKGAVSLHDTVGGVINLPDVHDKEYHLTYLRGGVSSENTNGECCNS